MKRYWILLGLLLVILGASLLASSGPVISAGAASIAPTPQPTDVRNVVLIGQINDGGAESIAVAGSHTHIADATSTGQVVNVAPPAARATVGTYDTPEYASDMAMTEGYDFGAPDTHDFHLHNPGPYAQLPTANPPNLALGRPAYASAVENTTYPASNAVDGNFSSRWSTPFSDPQWIYVDLGAPYAIQQVWLYWEAHGREYRIQASSDAVGWQELYYEANGDGGLDIINVSATGRYVRMYGSQRGTGWGYSLIEFEVYGARKATPTPVPSATGPALTATPTSPVAGTLLFSDNFDDGNYNGWSVIRGSWFVQNGSLVGRFTQCGGDDYVIAAGNLAWSDYQLSFDFKRVSGWDSGGIYLRYSETGYYVLGIHPSQPYGGSATLSKSGFGTVAQRAWSFETGPWYRFKIKLMGARIEVWLVEQAGDTLLLAYTDSAPVYSRGRFAFEEWAGALCNTEVWHDNVEVAALFTSVASPTPTPSPSPTRASTPTQTVTPTVRPTATATRINTPAATRTPTRTATRTATPTVTPVVDPYEPDDACAQARPIPVDGTLQRRTFYKAADADWVSFDGVSGTTYLIEARTPADSAADVVLELYDSCATLPHPPQDPTYSPGVRMEFRAPASGRYFLRLANHDPDRAGESFAYELSVRALAKQPTPGALILVAGRLYANDYRQPNIHHVTDAIYNLFLARGYDRDRIFYLATDANLDPDHDGASDVDALASRETLRLAITQWAPSRVGPDRALTVYLMDHGGENSFYLNGRAQFVTPDDLSEWISQLERARPGVNVNVIVDACQAGSFIVPLQTISKPGRVVITSTSAHASAYTANPGAAFSNAFVQALGRNLSLYSSFAEGRESAQQAHPDQVAWLDDDGDGRPNEPEDGQIAQRRGFAYAGTLPDDNTWPPFIAWARSPARVNDGRGLIEAEVRDDRAILSVWATIYRPSYVPPAPGEELVVEILPTVTLFDPNHDGVYTAEYERFDENGEYRIVIFAVDDQGLQGRPQTLKVWVGDKAFLPLLLR